jgi:hypothetical protein
MVHVLAPNSCFNAELKQTRESLVMISQNVQKPQSIYPRSVMANDHSIVMTSQFLSLQSRSVLD